MQIAGPFGEEDSAVEVVKVESALDRMGVTLTFNKALRNISKRLRNFQINPALDVLSSALSADRRQIMLQTSIQTPGQSYEITFPNPTFIRDMTDNINTLNETMGAAKFEVGWRFINLSDWHSAEKYIWDNVFSEREKVNDVKLFALLKERYGTYSV